VFLQAQLPRRLETVDMGHAHIEKRHIGREFVGKLQRFGAVRRQA